MADDPFMNKSAESDAKANDSQNPSQNNDPRTSGSQQAPVGEPKIAESDHPHRAKYDIGELREWTKAIIELATLGAVIWYACIASGQLTEMVKATKAARDSADAALLSAQAIRPRLAVVYLSPQPLKAHGLPIDQGRLHAWFQLPNYGPNAAQNVKICEFDEVASPSKIVRLPYKNCQSSSSWSYGSTIIPPITELPGNEAPGWGMDGSHMLTSEEAIGLKNPAHLNAVFSVMATYEDAAGKIHHAESCIVFTFQPKWGTQSTGPVTWGSKPCPWETQNN